MVSIVPIIVALLFIAGSIYVISVVISAGDNEELSDAADNVNNIVHNLSTYINFTLNYSYPIVPNTSSSSHSSGSGGGGGGGTNSPPPAPPPVFNDTRIIFNSPSNTTNTTDTTPEINFTITDNISSSISYKVFVNNTIDSNGTAQNNTPMLVNISVQINGTYGIVIEASNGSLGARNSTILVIIIDTSLPNVTITAPANATNTTTSRLGINFTITDDIFSTFTYKIFANNTINTIGNATSGNNSATLATLNNGTYFVSIEATDPAGNVANSSLFTLTVNTTILPGAICSNLSAANNWTGNYSARLHLCLDSIRPQERIEINLTAYNITCIDNNCSDIFIQDGNGTNISTQITMDGLEKPGNRNVSKMKVGKSNFTILLTPINPTSREYFIFYNVSNQTNPRTHLLEWEDDFESYTDGSTPDRWVEDTIQFPGKPGYVINDSGNKGIGRTGQGWGGAINMGNHSDATMMLEINYTVNGGAFMDIRSRDNGGTRSLGQAFFGDSGGQAPNCLLTGTYATVGRNKELGNWLCLAMYNVSSTPGTKLYGPFNYSFLANGTNNTGGVTMRIFINNSMIGSYTDNETTDIGDWYHAAPGENAPDRSIIYSMRFYNTTVIPYSTNNITAVLERRP